MFVALWICYHEIACIDHHQTGSVGEGSYHLQLIKFVAQLGELAALTLIPADSHGPLRGRVWKVKGREGSGKKGEQSYTFSQFNHFT